VIDAFSGAFDNQGGPSALSTAGSARWLVYSNLPSFDTVGGLAFAFKQYGALRGITPVQGTGNGLLYANVPTYTATLSGSVNRQYDTGTTADLSGVTLGGSGALAGDSVVVSGLGPTGSFDNKNAGSGKIVSAGGLSVIATDIATGAPIFGYQFSGTASGAIGTITPAPLAVSGLTASNKVYDAGTAAPVSGTPVFVPLSGDTVTTTGVATATFADKNVGTAKPVTLTGLVLGGADAGNYTPVFSGGLTADITPAALAITGLNAVARVYDGTLVAPLSGVAGVSPLGTDVVTVAGTAAGTFANKNVGTAKAVALAGVSLSGTDAGNYTLQLPALTADVTPLGLPLAGLTAANKVYDGNTTATLGGTASVAVLAGDTVTLAGTAQGLFADRNAGTAKPVAVSGLTLAGADAGNYQLLTQPGLAADISAALLAVTGLQAQNKIYDAGLAAPLTGTALIAPLGGDVVALAGTATGQFADKNVGTAKAVTVSGLTLTGADAGNYTLQAPAGLAADITPLALPVTGLSAVARPYDATSAVALAGAAGVAALSGDVVSVAGTPVGTLPDRNAGVARPVAVSGLTLAGTDAGNYTLVPPAGLTVTINPLGLAVSGLSALSRSYDGGVVATLAGTAAVTPLAGDVLVMAGTPSGSFADRNVGTAKPVSVAGLSLSGPDAGNYSLLPVQGLTADITPALLTVTGLAASNKVYDATLNATVTGGLAGVIGGEQVGVNLPAQFVDANVGTGKAVAWTAQLLGPDAGNYTLSVNTGALTADITPATLSYLAAPLSVAVGQVPALGGTVVGFLGSDTLANATTGTLLWSTPATLTSPVGTYAITGSGLSALNYGFVQDPFNASALRIVAPSTGDAASTASSVALNSALGAITLAPASTTLSSGRVLDAVPAFGTDGDGASFRGINVSAMSRDEIQTLLAARTSFKQRLFADSLSRLLQDPALADVRPCRTEQEALSGLCLVTEALIREIRAAREQMDEAQRQQQLAELQRLNRGRRIVQAALPVIERKLALVIGINEHADKRIPELVGAVPDAKAIGALLEESFGYDAQVLLNARKDSIMAAFNKLALEARPNDSVIVYYAGHGVVTEANGQGYWLPADADSDTPQSWVSNADIGRLVSLIGSRQLMLVSDSCYSGTLVGNERVQVAATADASSLLQRKAVVVMSSGGNEPVSDEGKDGHSVFAWHFMQRLKQLEGWTAGSNVFERIRDAVSADFPQTPQYGASRAGGHQGGTDYLYERRQFERPAVTPAQPAVQAQPAPAAQPARP
jgi:hypothetical protein